MKTPLFKAPEDIWNGVATLLFLTIFGVLIFVLIARGSVPHRIDAFDFILLSLASFRLIRLITYDKIADFVREYFHSMDYPMGRTVFELLICPWCTGIWTALVVVSLYTLFPFGWLAILLLAIAGLSSSIQVTINGIIRYAEKSKLEKQMLEKQGN